MPGSSLTPLSSKQELPSTVFYEDLQDLEQSIDWERELFRSIITLCVVKRRTTRKLRSNEGSKEEVEENLKVLNQAAVESKRFAEETSVDFRKTSEVQNYIYNKGDEYWLRALRIEDGKSKPSNQVFNNVMSPWIAYMKDIKPGSDRPGDKSSREMAIPSYKDLLEIVYPDTLEGTQEQDTTLTMFEKYDHLHRIVEGLESFD